MNIEKCGPLPFSNYSPIKRKYTKDILNSNMTQYFQIIAELQICQTPQSSYWLENLEGSIFARVFGWLINRPAGDSSDVTLAFEDALF